MKSLLAIVWFLCLLLPRLSIGQTSPSNNPLIVLVERNPWLEIIGSDSPSFVLYEDGLVIFRRLTNDHKIERASVVLEPAEKEQFLATLPLGKAFDELSGFYRLSLAKDLRTNSIFVWRQGKVKDVSLYGDEVDPYYEDVVKSGELAPVPKELRELLTKIRAFNHKRAQPWYPAKVEIIANPHRVDPKQAIPWPKDLPDIKHSTTVRRGDLYSIYIDYTRLLDLSKLSDQRDGSRVFSINGKTYSVSVRYPFPSEAAWMR